ncbi:uncharacterized protein PAC_20078 [Phialocephala subalpina]|uniref:Uncharacterized protein n=1 Tax=Phialocephala subalpina TaxID=576137 RepID=A0A1L7XYS6_9HELO|nr:uncharacterized protein PAC_20078 [Phialocephala subalpina]
MEMYGSATDGNRPRKATSKLTIWLATSFALLVLYLTITTTLNVREITKLSDQLRALSVNVTALENDNHGHGESTNRLDKRDDGNASFTAPGLQLVPHPIYYNVQTMPMVYPNTTAVSTRSEHEKLYLWWLLGGAFKVVETGFALYQLATSCQSWAADGSSETSDATKIGCVYGAISTLITIAGAAWIGANAAAAIGIALAIINSVTKRDLTLQNHAALLLDYQTTMVNTTGLAMAPMFNMDGELMVHNKSGMPLMFGYNPKGDGMVFTHTLFPGTNTSYMAYGFVPAPSANSKRDDYFNEEDFTSGGLEAGFSYNQNSDGGYLSTANDYGQMDHEVSCTYAGLADNALEFQIYDNNHDGTIAAGNIRAYQSGVFDIADLTDATDAPLPEQAGCQVAR